MSKFQVNERVAMFNHNGKQIVKITCNESNHDGVIMVEVRPEICVAVHEKQLRKLKKRRVVWIKKSDMQGSQVPYTAGVHTDPINKSLFIKFIEAKEK